MTRFKSGIGYSYYRQGRNHAYLSSLSHALGMYEELITPFSPVAMVLPLQVHIQQRQMV